MVPWEHLTRYFEDGRLEIDNNGVENAIRPIAIGRNCVYRDIVDTPLRWLFCGVEST